MTWDRSNVIPTILERIANGESLRSVCRDETMPGLETVRGWLATDDDLSVQYARALVERADFHFDKGIEIVSEVPPMVGDTNHKAGDSRMDSGYVAWQRVRFDAHRWAASKLNPRKYAEVVKQQVTGLDDGPVEYKVSVDYQGSAGQPAGSLPLPPRAYR